MYSRRQEPFPLLEGRLAALCQQLGESVVTAPGMATTQMILPSLDVVTDSIRQHTGPKSPKCSKDFKGCQKMIVAKETRLSISVTVS